MEKQADYLFTAANHLTEVLPEIPVNSAYGIVLSYFAVDKNDPNGAVDGEKVTEFIQEYPNPKNLVNALLGKMAKLDFATMETEECFQKIKAEFERVRREKQKEMNN